MKTRSSCSPHQQVIQDFLQYLNSQSSDYILKGDNSLTTCYGLDRESSDIDLDSLNKLAIKNLIEKYCESKSYSFRVAKDTDTVKRYMIDYGDSGHPLKIEISYRRKNINKEDYHKINNINVYTINIIAGMKTNAYLSRDKIRDLYDVVFICESYWDELSKDRKEQILEAFDYKGLEQFDYLVENSEEIPSDIDLEKLADSFLSVYERIGINASEEERKIARGKESDPNVDI